MAPLNPVLKKQADFCTAYGISIPILMAPMAGSCPPELARAVSDAGGMGSCGCLTLEPDHISDWVSSFRGNSQKALQMNLWIPDPAPERNEQHEQAVKECLRDMGMPVGESIETALPDFNTQCDSLIAAGPTVISSIMGVYPPDIIEEMKSKGIKYFATVTTVTEALIAEAAGADVIVAQGAEAGGHRGAFDPANVANQSVGLFSLLPAVVDAVDIPVVATGGIADARGVAAALLLGASAVQIGTGLLRSDESSTPSAWSDAISKSRPENTMITRAYSGRPGRSITTDYTRAMGAADTPEPAPYPVQKGITAAMRTKGGKDNDIKYLHAWAGQSAQLSSTGSAFDIVQNLWKEAKTLLGEA